jgi:hypothetical protein
LYDTVIYTKPLAQQVNNSHATKQNKEQPVKSKSEHSPESVAAVILSQPQPKKGDRVVHKTFGQGLVISLDERFVYCRFEGNRDKKFFYPQVFEQGYLSFA